MAFYPSEAFELVSGAQAFSIYRFPPHEVNHYFCKHCGIYPFHDVANTPEQGYRVNLGCVDEIDPDDLSIKVFDGRDSWKYLD